MMHPDPPPDAKQLFLRMGGWFVIGLGLLVLVVTLLSQSRASLARQFELESRTAEARVTNRYIRQQDGGTDQVSFIVAIRFSTAEGKQVRLERGVPEETYRALRPGATLDVRYLPDDPDTVEVTDGAYRSGAVMLQRLALGGGVVWLVMLWRVGSWAVGAVRAREHGALEAVEVVRVQRTTWRLNRQRLFRLVWRDAQGTEGHSLLNWRRRVAPYRPGTTTHVYRGSRDMWWVGDVGERAEDPPGPA
ncbi:MAG: DUF3592 domain-containing protein [Pseudomonadota bacterium]